MTSSVPSNCFLKVFCHTAEGGEKLGHYLYPVGCDGLSTILLLTFEGK